MSPKDRKRVEKNRLAPELAPKAKRALHNGGTLSASVPDLQHAMGNRGFRDLLQGLKLQRQAGPVPLSAPTEADLSQRIESARGGGQELPKSVRSHMESAFEADFSKIRIHTGADAAQLSKDIGAHAFTTDRDIFFGQNEFAPNSASGKHLLAHELTHTIQQGSSPPLGRSSTGVLNARPATQGLREAPQGVQAAPKVTAVVAAGEIGVGKSINVSATVAGGGGVDWILNGAPAGVAIVSTGARTGRITAAAGALAGAGTNFTATATLKKTPADNAVSGNITVVAVTALTFAANPPLANQPFGGGAAAFPPGTAEPNRDGYGGNTAQANAVTVPAARPVTFSLEGGGARAGANVAPAQGVITPGAATGVMNVKAKDNATGTFLTQPLTVNPVPTKLSKLVTAVKLAPGAYGVKNQFTFSSSDTTGNPLTRIIGETVTTQRDDFGILQAVNAPTGLNPAPIPGLSAPANGAVDTVGTAIAAAATAPVPGVVAGQDPMDINNYVGPGTATTLPRVLIVRQGLHHLSWAGQQSNEFDQGVHRRSLVKTGPNFFFRSEQIFPNASAPVNNDAYAGPPLINLTNLTVAPQAPAAQAIAADGIATGQATVVGNVAGRNVNWLAQGPIAFNPVGLGAAVPVANPIVLQAGLVPGKFPIQVMDSVFGNRQAKGFAKIVPVQMLNIQAVPKTVPPGTLVSVVSVNAQPGGRTLVTSVDPAAAAAGVTAVPVPTAGPAAALPARQITVTRPAGFIGTVTVTVRDNIRQAQSASVTVKFR